MPRIIRFQALTSLLNYKDIYRRHDLLVCVANLMKDNSTYAKKKLLLFSFTHQTI